MAFPRSNRPIVAPPPTRFGPGGPAQAKAAAPAIRSGAPPPPTRFGGGPIAQMMKQGPGGRGFGYQTPDKRVTPEMENEILQQYFEETGKQFIPGHGSGHSGDGQNHHTTSMLANYNRIKKKVKQENRVRARTNNNNDQGGQSGRKKKNKKNDNSGTHRNNQQQQEMIETRKEQRFLARQDEKTRIFEENCASNGHRGGRGFGPTCSRCGQDL